MNFFKKFVLVLVFMLFGSGVVVLAEAIIPMTGNDGKPNVIGIGGVAALNSEYFLDQPLSTHGAKICLEVEDGKGGSTVESVDLKESNIENFSTNTVGNFEMSVKYGKYSYEVPYSVKYKNIGFKDQVFDFELGQNVDLSQYKLYCYDYFNNVSCVTTLDKAKVENIKTNSISTNVASVEYDGLSAAFDYSVFYYSRTSNYIAKENVCDEVCSFELLKFVGGEKPVIKIAKRILGNDIIEGIYTFDMKKIETNFGVTYLTSEAISKLDYSTKKLTIFSNVLQNSTELVFDLKMGDEIVARQPILKAISKLENFKQNFVLNENYSFNNLKIELVMSDNSTRVVTINSSNISNFSLDKVGVYTTKIKYFGFEFNQTYYVNYKKIEIYNSLSKITFLQNSNDFEILEIVCYDYENSPVAIKSLKDKDVSIFDIETTTIGQNKVGRILCYGATMEFLYDVV